jgi:hypothetical protein
MISTLTLAGMVIASTTVTGCKARNPQGALVDTTTPPPPPKTITIAAVGDIMMGTDYQGSRLPPQDGALLFADAAPILRAVDIAFGNLEGPITKSAGCTKNTGSGRSFAFRCPPKLARNLATAGFDVMSLANNHSKDFGYAGMAETKRILDSLGIQYSSKNGEVASFEIDGVKVGLIAHSTGSSPRSILNIGMCKEEVAELAPQYDILIISFHGGTEGTKALHTPYKFENLYGEPRGNVIQFAHEMIDAGADLVLGHGPHVPRGMEIYKGKLIAYSLGNFCTYRCMQLVGELGYAPLLVAEVDSAGNFLRGEIHSFKQIPPGGPSADDGSSAFKLMKALSIADFGTSAPRFADSLSFYPPDDSAMSAADIQALRDSMSAMIAAPDSAEPDIAPSVDSFLTSITPEPETSSATIDSMQSTPEPVEEPDTTVSPPDTSQTLPDTT